ncbi:HNH endonuclease [Halogranum tailed virus 1]|uniref:HNH endonuclease n=1 Tax=Halogranum tailed virus 1 TaxID=1273749 RepID=R4TML6_9CAUD|nr:HNH endonuclease [Halogranum tailed virus 1]AGM11398.1 hypothetical protein HGTV1_89 [Halogranum tailed virus 1]
MGSFKEDQYQEQVPNHVDKSQEEWDELSYHTQYYYAKEGRKEQIREQENKRRREKAEYINTYKSERGCINCDEDVACALDLHHVDNKEHNISKLRADDASYERIDKELEKCVVICANCHRKLHNGIIKPKPLSSSSS